MLNQHTKSIFGWISQLSQVDFLIKIKYPLDLNECDYDKNWFSTEMFKQIMLFIS